MSNIEKTFDQIISELKKSMVKNSHSSAVDIEINLESMEVSSSGIPIISRKNKRKDLTIKIATRINPED